MRNLASPDIGSDALVGASVGLAAPGSRARARAATRRRRRTVLILTEVGNEQFDQLAASLRRRGVRVVRVFTGSALAQGLPGRARTRWLRDRWLYDGCVRLREVVAQPSGPLAGAEILDVLYNEPTAVAAGLRDPAIEQLAASSLAFAKNAPALLLDKFAVNALLEREGVRIPAQISAAEMDAMEAAARLGLPLIVKARSGAAGEGVRLADTVEAAAEAVRRLSGGDPANAFYQQHIGGEMVMYGAVFDQRGPVLEHGLKAVSAQWALGPSARLELFDDPALLAAGRAVMRALGCRGMAEIGFIRDAEGRHWHIDANCRSWGNMISLLAIGVDYAGAYAAMLADAPFGEARRDGPAAVSVLPFALYEAIRRDSPLAIVRTLGAFLKVCRRGPGLRYATVISIKAGALLLGRLGREAWGRLRGIE